MYNRGPQCNRSSAKFRNYITSFPGLFDDFKEPMSLKLDIPELKITNLKFCDFPELRKNLQTPYIFAI